MSESFIENLGGRYNDLNLIEYSFPGALLPTLCSALTGDYCRLHSGQLFTDDFALLLTESDMRRDKPDKLLGWALVKLSGDPKESNMRFTAARIHLEFVSLLISNQWQQVWYRDDGVLPQANLEHLQLVSTASQLEVIAAA